MVLRQQIDPDRRHAAGVPDGGGHRRIRRQHAGVPTLDLRWWLFSLSSSVAMTTCFSAVLRCGLMAMRFGNSLRIPKGFRRQPLVLSRNPVGMSRRKLAFSDFLKALPSMVLFFGMIDSTSAADAPLVWRWSNPKPHGNNIIAMAQSGSFWVQVTEKGQIYTSADLRTWTPRASGTTQSLRAVTFFNDRIVIVGEAGTILTGSSASELQLISLGTEDWLESVAASPSRVVAAGDNGAIYTSENGVNWQRQSAGIDTWLRGVAYGTPAGIGTFVVVGEMGFIATSVDGRNWQRRNSGANTHLNHVSWNGGQFWAAGDNGVALASLTGIDWQRVSNVGATNTLNAVAAGPDSRLIVGDSELRLQDGRTAWSNELDPAKPLPPPHWTYLSAIWTGNSYLVGGRSGMLLEGFKTNSTSSPTFWLAADDSVRQWLWDIARLPQGYLAVGDRATILSSVNGVDWQQEVPPDAASTTIFLGIGGRTNLAVAAGNAGTIIFSRDERRSVVSTNANGGIITNEVSTLGIIWESAQSGTTADLQGVAAFGRLLVVTGGGGTVLTSPDAVTWTKRTAPTSKFLSSVDAFPGGVVAVGDDGALVTSRDAIDWTARNSGTTNWLYRVRSLGGRLLAVGQNGTILTSSDGASWTRQNSGTTRWLNDIEWIDNTYFVVGNQGTVLASADAIQWRDLGTITSKSLYGAATDNGRLIIVGVEGAILRTRVTPFDTPIRFVGHPRASNENIFLFAGEVDQRFTLDRSTNLQDWTLGPTLEITDGTGTLLYIDNTVNAPSMQFFRAKPAN